MYYAVYQTVSGDFSVCRLPSNITVFVAACRYASRMATSSDVLVSVVSYPAFQFLKDVKPVHFSLWL